MSPKTTCVDVFVRFEPFVGASAVTACFKPNSSRNQCSIHQNRDSHSGRSRKRSQRENIRKRRWTSWTRSPLSQKTRCNTEQELRSVSSWRCVWWVVGSSSSLKPDSEEQVLENVWQKRKVLKFHRFFPLWKNTEEAVSKAAQQFKETRLVDRDVHPEKKNDSRHLQQGQTTNTETAHGYMQPKTLIWSVLCVKTKKDHSKISF